MDLGRHDLPPGATALVSNARNVQIVDSTLSVVGGDVHNHYTQHYHYEHKKGVWAVLRSIPNFRKIYQDMLSKSTPGTGMWLVKGDKFHVWLEPNGDIKIFWGSGIPGAGKTLLASIVIERLESLCEESAAPICVCYVYFRYSERSEVSVRSVLEVLVKQTLERHPKCLAMVEKVYARHIHEDTEPTEAQLLALLGDLTRSMTATFYVLDALDEAPTGIQLAVVKALTSLNVKLFITSRPLKVVEAHFPETYSFPIIAQEADLDLHINTEMDQRPYLQYLLRQAGPSLRGEIASAIKWNCGGMFLHASLQLDALCVCISAHQVRRTLKAFPPTIEDVYLQAWCRILGQAEESITLAQTVLVWVLNASRSLTVHELECAIATCPDTHKFVPDRVVPGLTLIPLCCGLVTVEEESEFVRLVHYTAKEPLERLLHHSFPHPQSFLSAVCTTRLIDCGFQDTGIESGEELMVTLQQDPLLAYASESWAFHAQASLDSEESRSRTRQFVRGSRNFPTFTSFDRSRLFDILAPLHILCHYNLPLDLIGEPGTWDPNIQTKIREQTALIIVAWWGHESLAKLFTALPGIQVNLVDTDGRSALAGAAHAGRTGIVALLLEHPQIQVNLFSPSGWPALAHATRNGHGAVVALLIGHPKIQINLSSNSGWTSLMLATTYGHTAVVTILLAHPEIQVNATKNDGCSALTLATYHGHEPIVKALLAHSDIQVNLVDNQGRSVLMLAAGFGHEGIATALLTHPDTEVNLVNSHGWSALMLASSYGYTPIATALLAHPETEVNLVNGEGCSALMLAACLGHEQVLKVLLALPEIQVNLVDNNGRSALFLATTYGRKASIVASLLDRRDTQVNSVDNGGRSALMHAAAKGNAGVVQLLLATSGIDVNNISDDGDTAIKVAAEGDYEAVVRMLLEVTHIDTTVESSDGHTAMSIAVALGHSEIIKLLQDFELRNAVTPAMSRLTLDGDGEDSDSDTSSCYHDAEEG